MGDRLSVLRDPAPQAGAKVAYTGTAGTTTTWRAGPTCVWVWSTTDCYVAAGEGVVATVDDIPMPANQPMMISLPPGTGAPWQVSAIQIATGGTIYAKPFV